MRTTVLLITVVSTVILMVTFKGQRDAGTWGHAAKLVGRVTSRSGWRRTPGKKSFVSIATVDCFCHEGSNAAEYLRHSCSSLMSPQSLSLSHFQMLLMQRPLEQRYWFGRQLCSGVEEICKLLIVGGFVSVYLTTRRLPEAVRAYSHPSWCRCCCGAGSLGDTDTAALRWASLESGRRLGKRRCACGRAEADTAGCTAGRHKRYGLTRARTQFISFKPEEDWQHHHLPAWSSPLFFPL